VYADRPLGEKGVIGDPVGGAGLHPGVVCGSPYDADIPAAVSPSEP